MKCGPLSRKKKKRDPSQKMRSSALRTICRKKWMRPEKNWMKWWSVKRKKSPDEHRSLYYHPRCFDTRARVRAFSFGKTCGDESGRVRHWLSPAPFFVGQGGDDVFPQRPSFWRICTNF